MKKIIDYDDLPKHIPRIKSQGKLVLIGGVFDILHPGHLAFLQAAKEQGATLLVMLESDESVRKTKGEKRPINPQGVRAQNLSGVVDVDYVLLLPHLKNDLEYYTLVKSIQPDIIAVTASDPAYNKKSEQAKMVGGKIIEVIRRLPHSTTDLIEK